jgi:AhpD family alkylhydroperoxidase
MIKRFKMPEVEAEAYKAMNTLEKYVNNTAISPFQLELIKIRASQINGCAFCIDLHTKKARKLGETEQRIYLLNAWKEAAHIYSEEERNILELTEEITLISKHGVSDRVYQKAVQLFGEKKTAQLIMTIVTINAWNRIAISLKAQPGN